MVLTVWLTTIRSAQTPPVVSPERMEKTTPLVTGADRNSTGGQTGNNMATGNHNGLDAGGATRGDNDSLLDEANDALHNVVDDVEDGINDLTDDVTGRRINTAGQINNTTGRTGNADTINSNTAAGSTVR